MHTVLMQNLYTCKFQGCEGLFCKVIWGVPLLWQKEVELFNQGLYWHTKKNILLIIINLVDFPELQG